jgi:hypothetical protein
MSLEGHRKVADYNIEEGDVLDMFICLCGCWEAYEWLLDEWCAISNIIRYVNAFITCCSEKPVRHYIKGP